jgi:predicted transcriptional regulator
MASDAPRGSVALLAIKPRFAEAIIAGRKTVEFRRTRFSQPPSHIVLYASSPVSKVVAYFEVTSIKELTPLGLWRQFRDDGAIDHDEFMDYYRGAATGVAITVGNVSALPGPKPLHNLLPRTKPPQSFRYLCPNSMMRLAQWANDLDC